MTFSYSLPNGADPAFTSYAQVESHLDGLDFFRMTPGLERMEAVLESLGLRRPPYVVVQIVGTNGKGSTAAMLSSLIRKHCLVAGLYTSPHFLSPRERVRVDGNMLDEAVWTALASKVMAAGGRSLSYFEFVTALAVLGFAGAAVDVGVMETGLGGAFDAVTAMDADLVVLTPMDLDHQAVLGRTLREIAADKAGAVREGIPVVSASQRAEAWREIGRASREKKAVLTWVEPDMAEPLARGSEETGHGCQIRVPKPGRWLSLPAPPLEEKGFILRRQALPALAGAGHNAMRLRGEHQKLNACLALAAWERLAEEHWPGLAKKNAQPAGQAMNAAALAEAWLPGRMQYVPATERPSSTKEFPAFFLPGPLGWPPMLLDGAHNAHGMAALGLSLAREGIGPGAVIFACLEDKVSESVLHHLRALATGPIFVPALAHNPRAVAPEDLASAIGLNAVAVGSVREALEQAARNMAERLPEAFEGGAGKNPLLVCGSLYLLAEVYALRPDALEEHGSRRG